MSEVVVREDDAKQYAEAQLGAHCKDWRCSLCNLARAYLAQQAALDAANARHGAEIERLVVKLRDMTAGFNATNEMLDREHLRASAAEAQIAALRSSLEAIVASVVDEDDDGTIDYPATVDLLKREAAMMLKKLP